MKRQGRAVLIALALAGPAAAAQFNVTRMDDPEPDECLVGDCSLREAVIAANTNGQDDEIILLAGTYRLTLAGAFEEAAATGDLNLTEADHSVRIRGAGPERTIIDAGKDGTTPLGDRVFFVHRNVTVEIEDLTITGGRAPDGPRPSIAATIGGPGGGVLNFGVLTMINCTISGNAAGDAPGPDRSLNLGGWGGVGSSMVLTIC